MRKRNRFLRFCNELFNDADRIDRVLGNAGIAVAVFGILVAAAMFLATRT